MLCGPVVRFHGSERGWTEHLTTDVGAGALLRAVARAPLPAHLRETLDDIVAELRAGTQVDELGTPMPRPACAAVHQLHLEGQFPDVAIHDRRDRLFAVVEAQRGSADDDHIARLAAHYVPRSGARLGVLVAEGWRRADARHPAWAACPAPVVVVRALDDLHELDYQVAWVHHPPMVDGDLG